MYKFIHVNKHTILVLSLPFCRCHSVQMWRAVSLSIQMTDTNICRFAVFFFIQSCRVPLHFVARVVQLEFANRQRQKNEPFYLQSEPFLFNLLSKAQKNDSRVLVKGVFLTTNVKCLFNSFENGTTQIRFCCCCCCCSYSKQNNPRKRMQCNQVKLCVASLNAHKLVWFGEGMQSKANERLGLLPQH